MTLEWILFVVLVALVLYNNGVQAYIHFEAYPLIAFVGKAESGAYLAEYERRLTIPLLLPYGVTMLCNLALIFVHPDNLSVVGVIAAFVLNMAVAVTTMVVATPVYNRIKASGANAADMSRLMSINLVRLLLSTASSLLVLALLLTSVAA